jgi:hypothetical protein
LTERRKIGFRHYGLSYCFEFCDEFRFHLGAFLDFYAGFFPACGAVALAGLFADVLVDDVIDFGLVLICDGYVGFS